MFDAIVYLRVQIDVLSLILLILAFGEKLTIKAWLPAGKDGQGFANEQCATTSTFESQSEMKQCTTLLSVQEWKKTNKEWF